MKLIAAGTLARATNIARACAEQAWGDDGHKIVALIAQSSPDTDVTDGPTETEFSC